MSTPDLVPAEREVGHLRLLPSPDAAVLAARADLFALLGGAALHMTEINLVELSNADYDGLDPDVPVGDWTAAQVALDAYLYSVANRRSVGGARAQDMHYDLQRYLLPCLLERRASSQGPLGAGRLQTSDLDHLANMLAGERPLPAATVAASRLPGRLGLSCHWLTLEEAARVCGVSAHEIDEVVQDGTLSSALDPLGQRLVRAMDLRGAGLLTPSQADAPHGLAKGTAHNVLALGRGVWKRAVNIGVALSGNPDSVVAKVPLVTNGQRTPRPTARVRVPVARCAQVAAELHPVHQFVLWLLRLTAARDGECFGIAVGGHRPGWLHIAGVGGQQRYARDQDGHLVRTDFRPGTKGSVEGVLSLDQADREPVATAGVLTRSLPLAPSLDRLAAEVVELFHTDPYTGEVDLGARLTPGLREDDASGMAAFTTALAEACASTAELADGMPVHFTPHDLRASLNSDLEDAGVDPRLLRHLLGHRTKDGKALDVHDGHYDLGPSEELLAEVAVEIQKLLPAGLYDLRVPTTRLPQWGAGSRLAARGLHIERRLSDSGWYVLEPCDSRGAAPVVPAAPDAAESPLPATGEQRVSLKIAAAELGLSASQLKRLLVNGEIEGRKVARGKREVWTVTRAALDREKARRSQVQLPELAVELGIDRHALWRLVRELGVAQQDRRPGEAIHLSADEVQLVRAELARRAARHADSLPTSSAAVRLGMPEGLVQTLVRRGDLEMAPGIERGGRLTHVTLASVVAYEQLCAPQPPVAPDEAVVAIGDVRHVLGLTRHGVSHLVCARELAVVAIGRKQYVGVESLRRYTDRHPRAGAAARIGAYSVRQT